MRGLAIIPAFNEGPRIGYVVDRVRARVPGIDILVVDDCSRDDTAAIARRHGAHAVSHVVNLGYGAALQTGYKFATRAGYAWVVQLDGDGQHDPADVPALLAPIHAGRADVVIGSRFIRDSGYQMGATRSVGRRLLRLLLRACGGPPVDDPTSGYQALTAEAVALACGDFYPDDFPDVDVLLTFHRRGLRIIEVPVVMAPSPPGRPTMHAGLRAVYYAYKMTLATFRILLTPKEGRP